MEEVALVKAPAHLVSLLPEKQALKSLGTENKISPKPFGSIALSRKELGFCVGLVSWYFWLVHVCCLQDLRSPTMELFFKKRETEVAVSSPSSSCRDDKELGKLF